MATVSPRSGIHIKALHSASMFFLLLLGACQSNDFIPVETHVSPFTATVSSPAQETPESDDPEPLPIETTLPAATNEIKNPTPLPDCAAGSFVGDATISDGTRIVAHEIFLKVWRLQNTGSCPWPADLRLEHRGGESFGNTDILPVSFYPAGIALIPSMGERAWADWSLEQVLPGEIVDLPVMFQAPAFEGSAFSLWILRSPTAALDLSQVSVEIRIGLPETPEPSKWSGVWLQHDRLAPLGAGNLILEQNGQQVQGFAYTSSGKLLLIEGGLFDEGTRVEGTYGPPYEDGYPFTWKLAGDGQSFQGVYRDRIISAGAWCGARSQAEMAIVCKQED